MYRKPPITAKIESLDNCIFVIPTTGRRFPSMHWKAQRPAKGRLVLHDSIPDIAETMYVFR